MCWRSPAAKTIPPGTRPALLALLAGSASKCCLHTIWGRESACPPKFSEERARNPRHPGGCVCVFVHVCACACVHLCSPAPTLPPVQPAATVSKSCRRQGAFVVCQIHCHGGGQTGRGASLGHTASRAGPRRGRGWLSAPPPWAIPRRSHSSKEPQQLARAQPGTAAALGDTAGDRGGAVGGGAALLLLPEGPHPGESCRGQSRRHCCGLCLTHAPARSLAAGRPAVSKPASALG